MKAVFLDFATLSRGDLDPAPLTRILPDIRIHDHSRAAEILIRTAPAGIVCTNKAPVDRRVIEGSPDLKLIALAATGSNNIDLAAARERGIAVCNVRDYCTASVAQHVWGLVVTLTHHLHEYRRLATDGSWAGCGQFTMLSHPIRELRDRRLGIIGWGELGRAVAQIGEAFGMTVLVANRAGAAPQSGRVDLPELLREADIVSLHCPLNEATRGLIGARELALMKPDALLINTARGGLVDSQALAAALRERRLGGAGIDVLAQEPPVDGDALLEASIPNLIVTPHIAWSAREARQRCLEQVAENIRNFLAGRESRRIA